MKSTNPLTEERLQEILDKCFSESESKVFDKLDYIIGELETIREEQTIGYHQFKQLENKVEKYEVKITTLETSHS